MSRKPLPMLALLAFSQCFALSGHAQADWGYEEKSSASPAQASSAKAAEAKRPASALKPKAPTAAAPLKKAQVAPSEAKVKVILDERRCWLELFALCASSANEDDRKEVLDIATLSLDQKNRLTKFIDAKLAVPQSSFVGIVPIWTKLRPKILEEMDIKESYRLLFRALLRHYLSKSHETTSEIEMLQDLLGAVRIADSGPPILTEDAVNAYADMTCYLYQKRKPDRSVDGDDNRQTFALVVKDRFTRAPNLAAKTAMTNFDLTWACFRCRFLDVSTEQQEKLSALMASGDSKSSAQLKAELVSPTMLKIFALGPWSEKAKELKEEKATAGKLDTK
ncbi:hypothetical protein BH11CYA1_BH11CYA1_22100 [soil metagenome]